MQFVLEMRLLLSEINIIPVLVFALHAPPRLSLIMRIQKATKFDVRMKPQIQITGPNATLPLNK